MTAQGWLRRNCCVLLVVASRCADAAPLAPYLALGVGPRAIAMGGAFTGIADDVSAINWNPGGLGGLRGLAASASYAPMGSEMAMSDAAVALPAGPGHAGALISVLQAGSYNQRDESGVITGTETLFGLRMALAYGALRPLTENKDIGLGASLEVVKDTVLPVSLGGSLGAVLRLSRKLSVGAAMRHFGVKNDGVSWPACFDVGVAWSVWRPLCLSADVERAFGYDEIRSRFGTEWVPIDAVRVRGGVDLRKGQGSIEGLTGLTAGAGFKWGQYLLDYSYQPFGEIATIHRIAVTYLAGVPAVSSTPPVASRPGGVSSSQSSYQSALALYDAGDSDGAWRWAYDAVQADSANWQAWQLLGNCQYAKGDRAGALKSYEYSLQLNSENPGLKNWVDQVRSQIPGSSPSTR